ncbi:GPI-anchor transamidase [Smittium culicis]|uniref:GPI-anchor transamidase n=1 Tax=Smittium culicis TaxID=133412 RepID=A0A1R1YRX3_9FUNG|nr:GPI-anchor transamidase [Smittium culicis]
MYRTVKRLGIPDSNIILMLADDMACNPRNKRPGAVFDSPDKLVDLYGDNVEVDYRGYEVTVENFIRLLTGRVSSDTPRSKRLLTDEKSNILIYMTGHGGDEFLKFQDFNEISSYDIADAFAQMWEKKRYNEILFMIDTCQANTMYQAFYSPNIVAVGSSNKGQNSYSYHHDNNLGISVIDRFTYYNLKYLENVKPGSSLTLKDLFDSYNPELISSNPGVRTDLFKRKLEDTLISDFFGAEQNIELTVNPIKLEKSISEKKEKEIEYTPLSAHQFVVQLNNILEKTKYLNETKSELVLESHLKKLSSHGAIIFGGILVFGFAAMSLFTLKERDTERTRSRRNRASNARSTESFSKSYKQDYSSQNSANDNSDFESAKDSRNAKKITTKVKIKKTKFASEGQDSQDKTDGRTRVKSENFIEFDENVSLSKYKNFNGSSLNEHASSQLKLESHFIVRVPEEICESVYEIVNKRDIGDKIDITFIDNRRAVFRFEDQLYKAKLVDLPTITESYRTTDKKQILKVADISQMLLVEEKISGFEDEKLKKLLEIRDIAYPHGLAPPLQNVTRRRFRPRISNAKVESIEEEVMRLLQQDENALSISYELFDLSVDAESNIAENETEADAVVRFDDSLEANEDNESVMDLDDFDADLAAELDRGLEELDGEEDANEGGLSSNKTYTLEGVVSNSGKNKDGKGFKEIYGQLFQCRQICVSILFVHEVPNCSTADSDRNIPIPRRKKKLIVAMDSNNELEHKKWEREEKWKS